MRTRRTKRTRRKRSRRKLKRGGDSRNTWLPSLAVDFGRNTAYSFGNTMNQFVGNYASTHPSPLNQPINKF
jgi:hypothetical protein